MRVGDFSVEIVPTTGHVRELPTGHVLARPGQAYRLRLRNLGPLHAVADVDIDGERVTAGGLVLPPWSTTELEGPIGTHDGGCFTIVAEGDETVFGDDGGRDNPSLGLIDARFRRELPRGDRRSELPLPVVSPAYPTPEPLRPSPSAPPLPSRFPTAPPEWVPLNRTAPARDSLATSAFYPGARPLPPTFGEDRDDTIESAAGTGLTGQSDQQFVPATLGPLETEATVIRLRLVIGSEDAIRDETARPLAADVPARPAARP